MKSLEIIKREYARERGFIGLLEMEYDGMIGARDVDEISKRYAKEYLSFEKWLPVKGYEGLYLISNLGRCMNISHKGSNRALILRENITPNGYVRYGLTKDGITKFFSAHRLIMISFKPKRGYSRYQVNHKDGNKINNHIDNLEWVTPSENVKHAFDNGLNEFNYNRKNIKLTKEDAIQIYNRSLSGESNKIIAKDYNISDTTVIDIRKGRRWSKFTGATSKIKILDESNIPEL